MTAAGWALIVALCAGLWFVGFLFASLHRARTEAPRDDAEVDVVAQAIADCYGHGPLRVMDPHYQHEFRRDARAAIDAMQRRGSS